MASKEKIEALKNNPKALKGMTQSEALIMRQLLDVEDMADELKGSLKDIDLRDVEYVKGEKGEKGDKGDTGEQGIKGEKGDKGDTGDSGHTPTRAEIEAIIIPLIEKPEKIDTTALVNEVLAQIPAADLDAIADIVSERIPSLSQPIRDSLELLHGNERLMTSAIHDKKRDKGLDAVLDDFEQDITKKTQTIIAGGGARQAYQVNVDTTNFNSNLSSADDTVQKALETLDDAVTGSSAFTGLTDTPSSYTGQAGKFAKVKATEDGLEFGSGDGVGDMLAANNLSDLADPATARTNLGVDPAGTDNSTPVTVTDSDEIDFTLIGQDITASLKAHSIDESKLDTSVNASLDLADSALQSSAIGTTVQAHSAVLDATTASFTTADETKLDGVAAGATANSSDATLLDRANHTGTQTASTISDFNTAADARVAAGITGKQDTSEKDATGGYAGLTLFKINFKNAANTFTNFLTNATTAARTYTFPDKDGTVAMTSDITGTNSGTNTGDQTISITGDVTAAGSTGALSATVTKINGTALSGLATGILKNTTSTGVPSIATQGTDYYAPGGTDVAIADGGTGASTAADARTNLGLGTIATKNYAALDVAVNEAKGSDIASATTTDIGAATGNYVNVTGTTTITGLGTVQAGTRRIVNFTGALTLTHNATSLILPTAANITTAAGDTAVFVSLGSGNWKCVSYDRASGAALATAGTSFDGCRVYQNATTSIGGTTWTTILFQAENFDTNNFHSTVTNTGRITIPTSGKYMIGANVSLTNSAGTDGARLYLNGATTIAIERFYTSGSPYETRVNMATIYDFTASDYIEVQGYLASGGASSGNAETSFWAFKL